MCFSLILSVHIINKLLLIFCTLLHLLFTSIIYIIYLNKCFIYIQKTPPISTMQSFSFDVTSLQPYWLNFQHISLASLCILSIKWNLIKLNGPADGIVPKTTQNSARATFVASIKWPLCNYFQSDLPHIYQRNSLIVPLFRSTCLFNVNIVNCPLF